MDKDRDNTENEILPDYYGLFRISPKATQMDIVNAYRHAKLAYQPDSLAVYSLYTDDELEKIQREIEEAYRVLSDPEKRHEYDVQYGIRRPFGGSTDKLGRPIGGENVVPLRQPHAVASPRLVDYSGAELRRVREARGISLEAIAERTRISRRYLQAIENEDEANFPESVYLKGYLRQYSREIGADPDKVVSAYLARIAAANKE